MNLLLLCSQPYCSNYTPSIDTHTKFLIRRPWFSSSRNHPTINKSISPSPLLDINHFIIINISPSEKYIYSQPNFSTLVYTITTYYSISYKSHERHHFLLNGWTNLSIQSPSLAFLPPLGWLCLGHTPDSTYHVQISWSIHLADVLAGWITTNWCSLSRSICVPVVHTNRRVGLLYKYFDKLTPLTR